jgi:hypothetical protein
MPKKFVIKNPKKKDSGAKGIVVFFIIFFVILLAGLGTGYYFIQTKNKPKTEKINTNQNTTPPSTENTNTSTSTNVNVNTNTTSTNEVTNENTTSTTTNTNTATSTNTNIPIITVDTDQDGLTDLEEQTYQTDAKNTDSDKDGYKDGDEIKNLYNPLASIQKLIDSGLVIRYNNDLFRYEIFSPKAWLVKAIDDSRQKIELIPDNSTAELVRIEVQPNTTKKSLTDWQKSIYGSELMENFKLGNKSALRSSDKKKVLVVTDDYAYTITYEVSGGGANFETTFAMMLASFAFINPAP